MRVIWTRAVLAAFPAGTRRDRSTIEEEEVLTLTPQEKEAILLLRQAERPLQRQVRSSAMLI